MKQKNKILFLILLCLFFITGCNEEVKIESGTVVNAKTDTSNATGTLLCTRSGTGLSNSKAELSYVINYKKGYLSRVHSIEKVISDDSNILDQYEEAYNNIFKVYKDLKYYENTISRENDSVTSDTTIDYSKIDMQKLDELESTDQKLIKNGKILLKDWLTFAKNVGTQCIEK